MLVNSSYLLAVTVLIAVAAAPTAEPDEAPPDLLARLLPIFSPHTVVDWSKQRPRQQSHYNPVDKCPGSVVDSDDWVNFSWYLFYSPENGGTNCAIVRNRSGRKQWMSLTIRKSGGNWVTPDEGQFSSYAGPKQVIGTNGKCVEILFKFIYSDSPNSDPVDLLVTNMACG